MFIFVKKVDMRIIIIFTLLYINQTFDELNAQVIDPWVIEAENWDKEKYAGVTVANGMIGIVSSQEPFKVKDVVLSGASITLEAPKVISFLAVIATSISTQKGNCRSA